LDGPVPSSRCFVLPVTSVHAGLNPAASPGNGEVIPKCREAEKMGLLSLGSIHLQTDFRVHIPVKSQYDSVTRALGTIKLEACAQNSDCCPALCLPRCPGCPPLYFPCLCLPTGPRENLPRAPGGITAWRPPHLLCGTGDTGPQGLLQGHLKSICLRQSRAPPCPLLQVPAWGIPAPPRAPRQSAPFYP
jgi:hypothetical protein